jgi:predicted acyltransferase
MKGSVRSTRLASLDILRGLDLWLLLMIGPVLHTFLRKGFGADWDFIRFHADHVMWEGFSLWDIIMPLFMFMSGITIPFSMAKYRDGLASNGQFLSKLFRRFFLLVFFGWIVQGNILDLDFRYFHPYANTLQSIAVGYLFSALMFVYFRPKMQMVLTSLIFLGYMAAFIFTGMDMNPETNIAMVVDKAVLGAHRDGVMWLEDGTWKFNTYYQYTWVLSSLNFIVTVMMGCFAGQILAAGNGEVTKRKALNLTVAGVALIAVGLAMSPWFPIIKKIWSSSMTLYSGGICFLLMAATYYVVDVRKWGGEMEWIKYFGMNSIAAYMIANVIDFSSVTESFIYGLKGIVGEFYPVLIACGRVLILFFIMRLMYKSKIFLKV